MLSERIFFVIERITHILNLDEERKEFHAFCKNISGDENKALLELYSDEEVKEFLQVFSGDRIGKVLDLYSYIKLVVLFNLSKHKDLMLLLYKYASEVLQKVLSHDSKMEISNFEFNTSSDSDEIREALELVSLGVTVMLKQQLSIHMVIEIVELFSYGKIGNILELCSNPVVILTIQSCPYDTVKEILKLHSDVKIQKIKESYLNDAIKELLKSHSDVKACQTLRSIPRRKLFKFFQMYEDFLDDDSEEIFDKCYDSWRKKIPKLLELRERWFEKHHARSLFEVMNFFKAHEEEKEVLSHDVKKGIGELKKELSRIYNYLKNVEANCDDRPMLSEHEQRFYLYLSCIADSSDDILNHVISNDVVAHDIDTLLEKIRNSYNPSSTQPIFNVVVKDNYNSGGPQRIANMSFTVNNHTNSSKNKQHPRPKSVGHVPNRDVVGFNCEIQFLLNHLMQPQDGAHVVGIVGQGGSGKTTLAKHIYHHPEINSHFSCKVWVCVSQCWNATSILNSIWRQAAQNPKAPEMDDDQVVGCLFQLLCSESYLIVLDDIWCISAWYCISSALLPCSSESKVVVTTRNKALPEYIDPNACIVEPKQLNDDESYELFKRRVSLRDKSIPQDLLPLGMEMVKKCKGLPLAIVALAGVLRMDKRQSSWERLMHNMLNIANESTQGVVKEVLALSYFELPHHLKQCFLYLRVFPLSYEIEAQQLIEMWIAECLIAIEEDQESTAKTYLEEMVQRCIVEVVDRNCMGEIKRFCIHDLIGKMIIDINKGGGTFIDSLRLVSISTTRFGDEQTSNTLETSETDSSENLQRVLCLETNSHARSLILLENAVISQAIVHSLVKFRLLRVLIIRHFSGTQMPEEIGSLIHLRYLELAGVIKLPMSVGNLVNLWTLNIRYLFHREWNTVALSTLHRLKELRHLYLPQNGNTWGKIAVKKAKLKTLWNARGGKWMLSWMPELSDVLQKLSIWHITSEEELKAVFRTPSITANTLQTLELHWPSSQWRDMSILSRCKSLKKLKLCGAIGANTTIVFPPNLIKLEMGLTYLVEDQVMNIISKSCPHLRTLVLRFMAYIGNRLVCSANSFPLLEKLIVEGPNVFEQWIIEESAMPRLLSFTLKDCEAISFNRQAWKHLSRVPEVTFVKYCSPTRAYVRENIDFLQCTGGSALVHQDHSSGVSVFYYRAQSSGASTSDHP